VYSNSGDTNNMLHERYWTAPSYFPSLVFVKSLYCNVIIFVVIKCTVL